MRSAAAAPFCLLQVLEVNQGEGRKLARCKADPDLTRQGSCVLVNRQDQSRMKIIAYKSKLSTRGSKVIKLKWQMGAVKLEA